MAVEHGDRKSGMAALQARKQARQDRPRDARHGSQPDVSARVAMEFVAFPAHRVGFAEHRATARQRTLAQGRQHRGAAASNEQLSGELGFQRPDGAADSGLTEMQPSGGFSEPPGLDDRHESAQLRFSHARDATSALVGARRESYRHDPCPRAT